MMDPEKLVKLKRLQRYLDLGSEHLVLIEDEGFTIAHSDAERAEGDPLEECGLHAWLESLDGPPEEPGIYIAERGLVWHLFPLTEEWLKR